MVSIFNFKEYRAFMKARFQEMPKAGYGQALKLSKALEVHTTLVSQILKGLKTFTPEQAAQAADYLELNEMESDYFLLMVQFDRAGAPALRRQLTRQIEALRQRARQKAAQLPASGKLSEEQRAVFYSDWTYSAVRQLTAIAPYQSLDAVCAYFGFTRAQARKIVDFLLQFQLCVEEKGALKVGPASTHVETTSAWARMHHVNWRQKCIEHLHQEGRADVHFTAPLTLAHVDAEKVRELVAKFVEAAGKIVDPSPSESLHCLTVDWFEVRR